MKNRKFAAVLAGVMTAALLMTGCADKAMDVTQTAATVDGEEVSLGLANFAAKLQQAQTESYYMMFFGTGMWDQEVEEGVTLEQSTKENIMSMIQELYVVKAHAEEYGVTLTAEEEQKIKDAAAKFVSDNTETALEKMTATEEIIAEYLTLTTIQKKVSDEIIKGVDTNVSDEEAAQKKINYVSVSIDSYLNDDGAAVDYTEEEKVERIQLAETILKEAKEYGDFEAAIIAQGFTMAEATFGEGDGTLSEALDEAVKGLKEGEYTEVVQTEYSCYVAQLVSEFDKEATEEKKQDIIEDRESALYNETYAVWAAESELTVNEEVWAQVNFAAPITIVTGDEEEASDVQTYELDEEGNIVHSEDEK